MKTSETQSKFFASDDDRIGVLFERVDGTLSITLSRKSGGHIEVTPAQFQQFIEVMLAAKKYLEDLQKPPVAPRITTTGSG